MMKETEFIWMDGTLVKWKDAKIHVLTHTFHYGMGVFEGIRFYKTEKGSAVFRLKDHINRFFEGCKTAHIKLSFSKTEISNAVIETIKSNKIEEGYIRPIAFYGYGKMGMDPAGAPVNVAIAVWSFGHFLGKDAVNVKTSEIIRLHPDSSHINAKICGHYVNSIFALMEAKKAGCDEALMLDFEGNAAEGSADNLFIVKNNKLITPSLGNMLPGITRDSVIRIAKKIGINVVEKKLKLEEVYDSDESFLTGTAVEIVHIKQIDGKKIGKNIGEMTLRIKTAFSDIVQGKDNNFENWLSYVK